MKTDVDLDYNMIRKLYLNGCDILCITLLSASIIFPDDHFTYLHDWTQNVTIILCVILTWEKHDELIIPLLYLYINLFFIGF